MSTIKFELKCVQLIVSDSRHAKWTRYMPNVTVSEGLKELVHFYSFGIVFIPSWIVLSVYCTCFYSPLSTLSSPSPWPLLILMALHISMTLTCAILDYQNHRSLNIQKIGRYLYWLFKYSLAVVPIYILGAIEWGVIFPWIYMSKRNEIVLILAAAGLGGCLFLFVRCFRRRLVPIAIRHMDEFIAQKRLAKDRLSIEQMEKLSMEKNLQLPPVPKKQSIALPTDWNPSIQSFVKTHIEPYAEYFNNISLLEPIIQVLKWLDEYGNCSSVPGNQEVALHVKDEAKSKKKAVDIYKKVTLLDHSLRTASLMMNNLKENCLDYQGLTGETILCGLGHDIGKIEALRMGNDYMEDADHWIVSRQVLRDLIPDCCRIKSKILNAVVNHHGQGDSPLEKLLIQADHDARNEELRKGSADLPEISKKQLKPAPKYEIVDLSDIDMERCMALIGNSINVFEGSRHDALMVGGVVYVDPSLVSKTIGLLTTSMKIKTSCSEMPMARNIEYSFRQIMDEHIPSRVGKNFTGQKYVVVKKKRGSTPPKIFHASKNFSLPQRGHHRGQRQAQNRPFRIQD